MRSYLSLLLVATFPIVVIADCVWSGTAPACGGECSSAYPSRLTSGRGGCDNGSYCVTGTKALCCRSSDVHRNCEWYGTAPICAGECPAGKYQVGPSDNAGDGNTCATGCKVFCCDSAQDASATATAAANSTATFIPEKNNYFVAQPFAGLKDAGGCESSE